MEILGFHFNPQSASLGLSLAYTRHCRSSVRRADAPPSASTSYDNRDGKYRVVEIYLAKTNTNLVGN